MRYTSEQFQPGSSEFTETGPALRVYVRRAVNEPWRFLRFRLASLWDLWGPWPLSKDRPLVRKALLGPPRFVLFALALIGVTLMKRSGLVEEACILGGCVLAISAVHVMTFSAESRFTLYMEPLCVVLAAFAISKVLRDKATGE